MGPRAAAGPSSAVREGAPAGALGRGGRPAARKGGASTHSAIYQKKKKPKVVQWSGAAHQLPQVPAARTSRRTTDDPPAARPGRARRPRARAPALPRVPRPPKGGLIAAAARGSQWALPPGLQKRQSRGPKASQAAWASGAPLSTLTCERSREHACGHTSLDTFSSANGPDSSRIPHPCHLLAPGSSLTLANLYTHPRVSVVSSRLTLA